MPVRKRGSILPALMMLARMVGLKSERKGAQASSCTRCDMCSVLDCRSGEGEGEGDGELDGPLVCSWASGQGTDIAFSAFSRVP